jgi:hypothetical protein
MIMIFPNFKNISIRPKMLESEWKRLIRASHAWHEGPELTK